MENSNDRNAADPGLTLTLENDPVALTDAEWAIARRRHEVLHPLLALDKITLRQVREASLQLDLDKRTTYRLIARFRASGGLLSSLVRRASNGGRGKSRIDAQVEAIISTAISNLYLNRQKRRAEAVISEVRRRCVEAGLPPPGANTIRRRMASITQKEFLQKREGKLAAHPFSPNFGEFPIATRPLEIVMMDHTKVDLVVVDEYQRQPLGRPWLTVAVDIYSRCVAGFYLSFEAPSAVSVGLCLTQVVIEKSDLLARHSIEGVWPLFGKPENVFVDQGREFMSEALIRGCEQHGIKIRWRKKGSPHLSGVVERLIGTLMSEIHGLPGTTFSNVKERGIYDSQGTAALTLAELERWLTLAIVGKYHLDVHSTLLEPPLTRFRRGALEMTPPLRAVTNRKSFLIDFLPIARRTIQRHGFVIDHIHYFSSALVPWIAARKKDQKFIVRLDPRDLSRIFVLHPKETEYLEVPYRSLHRPAISSWEHRESIRRLREKGIATYDESSIFKCIAEMRAIEAKAVRETKRARRRKAIAANARALWKPEKEPPATKKNTKNQVESIFKDTEDW